MTAPEHQHLPTGVARPEPDTTPLRGLLLAAEGLDRHAELRTEPDLVHRLLDDPNTRVVAIRGDRVLVRDHGGLSLVHRTGQSADLEAVAVYLGNDQGGAAYVGVIEAPEPTAPTAPSAPTRATPHGAAGESWRTL
ncbi:MAG: hypothetical protein WAR57_09260, partial [Candidatus Phosphoribacter sp.]